MQGWYMTMNTLESTISMLETLSDKELQAIHDITFVIYSRNPIPLKPISKKQLLKDLELSRKQIEKGQYKDAKTAIDEIGAKYGI